MTEIVAEVGSNWRTFEEAKDSIPMAKNVGADVVKFQFFTGKELFGFDPDTTPDQFRGNRALYPSGWLPPSWLPLLKEKADACGIEFMCTAFSPAGVEIVDQYVKRHKVASSDLNYPQLLDAIAATGKPILLSTGGHSWSDIAHALGYLGEAKSRTTLLYCSSEYPSTWHNLRLINVMREKFGVEVGYSDHTIDVYTPVTAAHIHGASCVEKHFKLRADLNTPDSPHSLDPERFSYMVDLIRNPQAHMKMPNPGECSMILRHNRRLIALRDIQPGETFVFGENFGAYRSLKDDTYGLSPFAWSEVNGKVATKARMAGDGIGPQDF